MNVFLFIQKRGVLCKDKEIAPAGALITANPQGFYVKNKRASAGWGNGKSSCLNWQH